MSIKNFCQLICILFISLLFGAPAHSFPRHNAVPGGIALLALENTAVMPKVFYNNTPVALITKNDQNFAMIGLSLSSKPGEHHIEIIKNNGKKSRQVFSIKDKSYQEQHLTISNKRKVNPYEKDMDRIIKEKTRKSQAKKHWTQQTVQHDFIQPVHGRISSVFGLKRFFNEQARRPHSGLDIAAAKGTPIKAIESGTVIESGNFFFSGNMLYLDHGQGIISLYAHMNSIAVSTGDQIKKGQIIGTVGETGRVTGPHLHLALIVNQNLVDPLLVLPDLDLSKNTQ